MACVFVVGFSSYVLVFCSNGTGISYVYLYLFSAFILLFRLDAVLGRTLGLFDRVRDVTAWKDSRLIAPLIQNPSANQSA